MIDCMACLVALAKYFSAGGTHTDNSGITHATLRSQRGDILTCTIDLDPTNLGRGLLGRATLIPK